VPLGVREVLLVVRAQNMSSGVLRNLAGDFNNLNASAKRAAEQQMQTGSALMAVGTGIAAVGGAGLLFLGKATAAAMEYNRQVALTKTQMYGVKASFDDVAKAGLDVARKVAVPLDQIQQGLYDIFSSMDVNMTQAKFLLMNFAKEAVAGQVDLSVAERATIGVMNSYHMKVQDVIKVQDVMFNLVKYGVGTYENFANVIGRVTPSAVRANQTFEVTAGMMAFLTRNGLSAANAAASAGRALDAIGKSRDKIASLGKTVIGALGPDVAKKLGFTAQTMIKVTDSAGRLLPINNIMTNLGKALSGLNPTQLNDVLTAMFKGTGGTIQAMRFFNVAIHNFAQLNQLTNDMYTSRGALQAAYGIMANTPAAKIQLLRNAFKAFMIVLGDQLLPVVGKVAGVLAEFFRLIGSLPKPVLKVIAIVLAVVSVLLVLAGIVLIVVGAWMVLSAVIAAASIPFAAIALVIGIIIAVVAALAVSAYFIYKYWGPISKWFHQMWFDMWKWIDHIWQSIYKSIYDAWNKIKGVFLSIQKWVSTNFDKWWKTHGDSIKLIWKQIWDGVAENFRVVWDVISGIFKTAWAIIETVVKVGWNVVVLGLKVGWNVLVGVFRAAWAVIVALFKVSWAIVSAIVKIGMAGIESVVKIFWDVIVGIFSIFLDLITGHWHTALVDMRNMGIQVWNAIKQFLVAVWHAIYSAGTPIFNALKNGVVGVWHAIYNTTQQVWGSIKSFLSSTWGAIVSGTKTTVSGLGRIWQGIEGAFKIPVNFVIGTVYDSGIRALWNTVVNAIGLSNLDLPFVKTLASGGKIPGFGGGDKYPALLEAGEAVVDKNRTRKYAWLLSMMGVPGMAAGGVVPLPGGHGGGAPGRGGTGIGSIISSVINVAGAVAKMTAAAVTGNQVAFTNAFVSAFPHAAGAGELASIIATLPVALAKKMISGLWNTIAGTGGGAATYKPGAGVEQWRSLVARTLGMEGLSGQLVDAVLYQMQTESGGNPRAINLTDINAQHGDPSKGLMQVIMSTFRAYHWPGTAFDVYNPLANIAAALNYAKANYGPGLRNAYGGIGTGHGYAGGTRGAMPGWAWVGEHGPELVRFLGGETVLDTVTSMLASFGTHRGYATGTNPSQQQILALRLQSYELELRHVRTSAARLRIEAEILTVQRQLYKLAHPANRIAPIAHPTAEQITGIRIADAYFSGLVNTLSKIRTEQTDAIKAIQRYYSGGAATWRERTIDRQSNQLASLVSKLAALTAQHNAAVAYQSQVASSLAGYGALSNITLASGATATASGAIRPTGAGTVDTSLQGQLHQKLAQLKKFAAILMQLRRMGLSSDLLQQVIAMGPDDGYTYALAILGSGRGGILDINRTEAAIVSAAGGVAHNAAVAVYGKAVVDGFKSQQAALEKMMRHLGQVMGQEVALWLRVPSSKLPHYAGGSWYVPQTGLALVHEGEMILSRGVAGRARAGAGIGGATQNFYITTQEIDPRRHAAELGWELARRSS